MQRKGLFERFGVSHGSRPAAMTSASSMTAAVHSSSGSSTTAHAAAIGTG
jgi:hypothetical protein